MRTRNPQRLLAYALIVIGVIMLVSRIGSADWLWLALISGLFLFGYVSRKNYNFLVAGGVLMGIAVGTLIGTQSGMLLSLAAGFLAIDRVEPKPNRWALYSAGIFAVLGALVAFGSVGLLSSTAFALALVAVGAYLLYREGNKPGTQPDEPPTGTSTYTPSQAGAPGQPSQTPRASPTPTEAVDEPATNTAAETPAVKTQTANPPGSETAPPPPAAETVQPAYTSSAHTPANVPGGAAAPTTPLENQPPENQPLERQPRQESARPPEQPVLSGEAETRLRRLEAWRRETAAADGVPPYIVFSNDTLAKIAAANPHTLDELDTIKGVGPVKLSRYGETVLGVLKGEPSEDPKAAPKAAES